MEKNMMSKTKANQMREEFQPISKPKPKVRIVHIYAPEIIKIDAANFRELVQRLTGKPEERIHGRNKKKQKKNTRQVITRNEDQGIVNDSRWNEFAKENESGGYLSGFADVDGLSFLQGFGDLPMLNSLNPMDYILGGPQVV